MNSTDEQVKKFRWKLLNVTKVWPHELTNKNKFKWHKKAEKSLR